MGRTLDTEQSAAVKISGNGVVTAGAGSGKTTILAERYLRLLKQGNAGVENILTLTFTRKAAAQMRERIYSLLLENRNDPKISSQLTKFNQAQISTLDSFCARIVRSCSNKFGISPDFSIDQYRAEKLTRRLATGFLLSRREHPVIVSLVARYGPARVLDEVFIKTAEQSFSLTRDTRDFFTLQATKQLDFLETGLAEHVKELQTTVLAVMEIDPVSKSIADLQVSLKAVIDEPLDRISRKFSSVSLRRVGNSKKEEIEIYNTHVDRLKKIREDLLSFSDALADKDQILGIAGLADEFEAKYCYQKRVSGVLYFRELLELAVKGLSGDNSLRNHFFNCFRYIMIDEFQDNNAIQRDLLFLLTTPGDSDKTEPGRLFFVGDQKQSIYSFRGADVSVFSHLTDEITETGEGRVVDLVTNYRSAPGLLDFFNRIFPWIMADPKEDFEAAFFPLKPGREQETQDFKRVHMLYFNPEIISDTGQRTAEIEAYHVAKFIKEKIDGRELLTGQGKDSRQAEYKDVALLLRSTTNQSLFEQALRGFGIPYQADSLRSLFLEAPVNDIYSVLQCAVFPQDRVAYAAVLRSSFVRLSDEGVLTVLLKDNPPFDREIIPELTERDAGHFKQGAEIYGFIAENRDLLPLAELVSALIYDFGYQYNLLKTPSHHHFLEFFDYLIGLADQADEQGKTLPEFLDDLRQNLGEFKRQDDLTVNKQEQDGVRIMSIHRSKGLEFPVVVVADMGNKGKPSQSPICFISHEHGIALQGKNEKHPLYRQEKEIAEQKELAELKRLFYVALTRAEDHLILSGSHSKQNKKSEKCFLNLILPALGTGVDRDLAGFFASDPMILFFEPGEIPENPGFIQASNQPLRDVKTLETIYRQVQQKPVIFGPSDVSVSDLTNSLESCDYGQLLPEVEIDSIIKEKSLESAFGILCHSLVEKALTGRPVPDFAYKLFASELEPVFVEQVVSQAKEFSRRFIQSKLCKDIQSAPGGVECEKEFLTLYEDGRKKLYVSGKIDIVAVFENEVWVVDLKSGRNVSPRANALQINLYRKAASDIWNKPTKGFTWLFRTNNIVEIEWDPPDLSQIINQGFDL